MIAKKISDADKSAAARGSMSIGVLLSIHLTSNRPDQFRQFLDRLEIATSDMSSVEVVLKVDAHDDAMHRLLKAEVATRPFRIVYISTPLKGGFYDLWRSYDELLKVCDPRAYFIVGLNDEMYFTEKGWDTRLRKYVNLHPDHIYRLRNSMHRERNYYDYWEASCAGDLTPIMTKRWIELGGGWCPCNGPDSFQNAVAFYFGWLYRHDTFNRPYRDRIVHDIEFGAQGANLGVTDWDALRRRLRGAIKPWFILVSHPMQQEAARRAQKLHAYIWAEGRGLTNFEVRDNTPLRRVEVVDRVSGEVINIRSYRLSWIRITFTNTFRKLNYGYYGGGGNRDRWGQGVVDYLCLRHAKIDHCRDRLRIIIPAIRRAIRRSLFLRSFCAAHRIVKGCIYVLGDVSNAHSAQYSKRHILVHEIVRRGVYLPLHWMRTIAFGTKNVDSSAASSDT